MGQTKNLHNEESIKKIKELVKDITTCMFCTEVEKPPFKARPMATLDVDDEGNVWFMSSRNSSKNDEIKTDAQVQLIYAKGGSSHFLSISGKARITKDKKMIDQLWNGFAKAWFQEGKDDPNIA